MKIFGRKIVDLKRTPINAPFDELVFEIGEDNEVVISLHRARVDGRIEIRTNGRTITVMPRASNLVEIETR